MNISESVGGWWLLYQHHFCVGQKKVACKCGSLSPAPVSDGVQQLWMWIRKWTFPQVRCNYTYVFRVCNHKRTSVYIYIHIYLYDVTMLYIFIYICVYSVCAHIRQIELDGDSQACWMRDAARARLGWLIVEVCCWCFFFSQDGSQDGVSCLNGICCGIDIWLIFF